MTEIEVKKKLRCILCSQLSGRKDSFCDNGVDDCDGDGGCFICEEIADDICAQGVTIVHNRKDNENE